MKVHEIREAIHKGTKIANKKYANWTGGSWITDHGVEGWLVGCIAESIYKRIERNATKENILMEVPFQTIKEWSDATLSPGRKPEKLKGRNRADLVLFNARWQPTCVIEVKRKWNWDQCYQDLERIKELVCAYSGFKGGTLRRGLLTFMIPKVGANRAIAQNRINAQIDRIKDRVDNENYWKTGLNVKHYQKSISFTVDKKTWLAVNYCIELSMQNNWRM